MTQWNPELDEPDDTISHGLRFGDAETSEGDADNAGLHASADAVAVEDDDDTHGHGRKFG